MIKRSSYISGFALGIIVTVLQQSRLLHNLSSSIGSTLRAAEELSFQAPFDWKRNPLLSNINTSIYDQRESPPKQLSPLLLQPPPTPPASSTVRRNWAYAFLVAGVDPSKPELYRGFLYNIFVSSYILHIKGSRATIVVLIQMSCLSKHRTLPQFDVDLLKAANITIRYLPKFRSAKSEHFYAVTLEKFRVLELDEYSRVLFLDSDVMPMCSLDYLFELSEPEHKNQRSLLKENVVLAWKDEPAHAALFMMRPSRADYEELQHVIRKKEEKALALPYPHWNEVEGWGHNFSDTDDWRSPMKAHGMKWDWHAVIADQGLLYYWTKYCKKDVSLIIKHQIEHWGRNPETGAPLLEATFANNLSHYAGPASWSASMIMSPYRDYRHYSGMYLSTLDFDSSPVSTGAVRN